MWTDETIAELRRLWAEGVSTVNIGRALGISKGAVVGKAHRLDLPLRDSPIPGAVQKAERKLRAKKQRAAHYSKPPRVTKPKPTPKPKAAPKPPAKKPQPHRDLPAMPVADTRQLRLVVPKPKSREQNWNRACKFMERPNKAAVTISQYEAQFCCAPIVPGTSYCPDHYITCFVSKKLGEAA